MAVQARDGRSRVQLPAIGRLAMRAWPDAKQAPPKLPRAIDLILSADIARDDQQASEGAWA
jgi:hypothetical protein